MKCYKGPCLRFMFRDLPVWVLSILVLSACGGTSGPEKTEVYLLVDDGGVASFTRAGLASYLDQQMVTSEFVSAWEKFCKNSRSKSPAQLQSELKNLPRHPQYRPTRIPFESARSPDEPTQAQSAWEYLHVQDTLEYLTLASVSSPVPSALALTAVDVFQQECRRIFGG